MLDLLVKSKVRRKIVGFFAINPKEELYSQEVAQEIKESPHAVGLELKFLARGGLLHWEKRGHQTYYQWNPSYPFAILLKETIEKMRKEKNREIHYLADLEQRRLLEKNLEQVLEEMKKYYDPEKVIVFGSMASGCVGPYSDIDLVVIKKTSLPYFKRIKQLIDLVHYDVGIDFFVYTPEEFNRALKERRFFQKEIVGKGKVLYEKTA